MVYVKTTVQKVSMSYRQRHARRSYSAYIHDEKLQKYNIRFYVLTEQQNHFILAESGEHTHRTRYVTLTP